MPGEPPEEMAMPTKRPSKKGKIPPGVLKQLSRELAAFAPDLEIRATLLALTPGDQLGALGGGKPRDRAPPSTTRTLLSLDAAAQAESWWDRKRDALLKRAAALRDTYRNNPYIEVTGFSIEIGISPSLTIDFEFK
jgi:hypothetical protein